MTKQNPLSALIVDDELLARENLKILLEDFCPEVRVVGSAGDIEEGKRLILELRPQVIFLDIRMPSGAEGFDLLESIEVKDFQVIFVTAFKDYAVKALNANAIHYILKPIDIEDLQYAVKKLVEYQESFEDEDHREAYVDSINNLSKSQMQQEHPSKLTLYHNKGFKIVETKNIVRLEADSNCTSFFFADGTKYLDTKTLKVYEDLLPNREFVRIHKSHVINLHHLKEYTSADGHIAIMKNGHSVPVARGRLSHFLSLVKDISF
jgi:two-component system LytT family response regulator